MRRSERGAITLEAIMLAGGLMLLAAVLMGFGRITLAGGSVEAAASEAARSASLARDPGAAVAIASSSAVDSLERQGLRCAGVDVSVDTGGFATPPGSAANVTATVTCTVELGDLAIPGMPGQHTITTSAVSPLDTYRERR